jgi:hypothetical protein
MRKVRIMVELRLFTKYCVTYLQGFKWGCKIINCSIITTWQTRMSQLWNFHCISSGTNFRHCLNHAYVWHGIAAHRSSRSLSFLHCVVLWLVLIVVSTDYLVVSGVYWNSGKEKAYGVNCLKRCWCTLFFLRLVGKYYVKKESETRVSEICSKWCEGAFCNRSSCVCSMLWCMVSHEYVSWWVDGNMHVV